MNTHPLSQRNTNKQRKANHFPGKQGGVMLLEALISILIFSFGILAIIGLQAAAIKNAGDAKYRTDASQLANQLIGQMWVDDRTPATLLNNYNSSTNGVKYQAWLNDVAASGLPGQATVTPPSVTVATINNPDGSPRNSLVTVTIRWKSPSEAETHQYTAVANII